MLEKKMLELFIRTLSLLLVVCTGSCERGLFFQPDNIPTTESLAILPLNVTGMDVQEPISSLSVCIRLKVHHYREQTYVFSYATSNKDNNEMNMGLKVTQAFIGAGGECFRGPQNLTLVPMEWYHVCFTISSTHLLIYVNGEINIIHDISSRKILLNASLVLGQETDQVLGGYQKQQSFSGIITEFNLYSRVLSKKEVQSQFQCEDLAEGDLIAWSSTPWQIFGSVQEITVNKEDYCSPRKQVTLFPERRSFIEANHWCVNQKANIYIPQSAEENIDLYNASKAFLSLCQPPNHATVFLWLGATDEREYNKFLDLKGNPLMYENFYLKKSSLSNSCLGMMIPPSAGKWDDVKCFYVYHFCVPCEEPAPTIYKMRGLCEQDYQSILLRLSPENGKKTSFRCV